MGQQQESQLSACLDGLRGVLESRKPYVAALKQVVDTDALMTVDHSQVRTDQEHGRSSEEWTDERENV